MCREFYSIGSDNIGKYIRYHGFLWARDNAAQERGEDGELLDYAFTHGDVGVVYLKDISGDPREAVAEAFDVCQQYQTDMSEGQRYLTLNNYYDYGVRGERLHMTDVEQSTPCGDYFFDDADVPHISYISSKTYANEFSDYLDGFAFEYMRRCAEFALGEGSVDSESSEFVEACYELVREHTIPALERLGFAKRPDMTDF